MAGVSPRFRLGDVLRGEQDVDSVLVTLAPGLQLLPGSSGDPSLSAADAWKSRRRCSRRCWTVTSGWMS